MKGGKFIKKFESTQSWLSYSKIFNNGMILSKGSYLKILKIIPINYDLKSNLEKEAILNSYMLFLKTINFDSQILIQSRKEKLSKHISKLKEIEKINNDVSEIYNNYYSYIQNMNNRNKSSSKNYYIVLKYKNDYFKSEDDNKDKIAIEALNDMYYKVKETLTRCGNLVLCLNTKEEIEEILFSFYNLRLD